MWREGWEINQRGAEHLIREVNIAKERGIKIYIGGDLNGHIWELDGEENRNGRLI